MSYSIIPTHRFEKELKRLVKKFSSLKANPETGTFLGNNCYKIRFAIRIDILPMSKARGFLGFKQQQREHSLELHHLALP